MNLDDQALVSNNAMVAQPTPAHMAKAFTTYDPELYIPLTFLSYQIETAVFGMQAWHFHLINLLLHLGCTAFVFLIIRRLLNAQTALIAATLFALHPINTEAVAWISARKDLLSTFFALASVWQYLIFKTLHRKKYLIASIVLFACALLSKISVMMVPLLFVLIDWQQSKTLTRQSITRKWPFAALSLAFFVVALFGKKAVIAHASVSSIALMAFRSSVFYLQKIFYPTDVSVTYLYEHSIHVLTPDIFLSIVLVIAISIPLWLQRKRWPHLLFGWAWFLLILLPTFSHYSRDIRTVQVASDRYVYLAAIGIFCLIAQSVSLGLQHLRHRQKYIALSLLAISVIILASLSSMRLPIWKDSIAMNQSILKLYPNEWHALFNLAQAMEKTGGDHTTILNFYHQSAQANRFYMQSYLNPALLLIQDKKYEQALTILDTGLQHIPNNPHLIYARGLAYQTQGKITEAIAQYERAVTLDGADQIRIRLALAQAYGAQKRFVDALDQYKILMDLDPAFKERVMEEVKVNNLAK